MSGDEQLRLSNQLCFPLYVASRMVIREYQPHLNRLGITYPQYLALMALWERDGLTVNAIARRLLLNTNTVTPLLQRMETLGLVVRHRSARDERQVTVALTPRGEGLKEQARCIPLRVAERIASGPISPEELTRLKVDLDRLIGGLSGARGG